MASIDPQLGTLLPEIPSPNFDNLLESKECGEPDREIIQPDLFILQHDLAFTAKDENIKGVQHKFDQDFDPITRKRRGRGFTTSEDEQLCRSWLDISQDAIIGTDQDGGKLWDRMLQSFKKHIGVQSNVRTSSALMNQWSIIQKDVTKFTGFLRQIELRNPSGFSYEDIVRDARICFNDAVGKKFAFHHCWVILRDAPKWQTTISKAAPKSIGANKTAVPDLDPEVSSAKEDLDSKNSVEAKPTIERTEVSQASSSDRPQGRKAAKRAAFINQEIQRKELLSGEVLKTNKRLAEAVERRILIAEAKAEEVIMGKDLTKLSPLQREWYEFEQERIMHKRRKLSKEPDQFALDQIS